jgi:hypothetical protein
MAKTFEKQAEYNKDFFQFEQIKKGSIEKSLFKK